MTMEATTGQGGSGAAAAEATPAAAGVGAVVLTAEDLARAKQEGAAEAQALAAAASQELQGKLEEVTQKAIAAGRKNFINENMKGIPPTYINLLPQTDDPAALAAAAETIRQKLREDIGALGLAARPLSSSWGVGEGAVLPSQMRTIQATPTELVAMGMKKDRPRLYAEIHDGQGGKGTLNIETNH